MTYSGKRCPAAPVQGHVPGSNAERDCTYCGTATRARANGAVTAAPVSTALSYNDPLPPDVREYLKAQPEYRFELIYVDYQESLGDEQLAHVLAGRINRADEEVSEIYSDHAWDSARTLAEEILEECDIDPNEEVELRDVLEEEIRGMDTSDPLAKLLRLTPNQFLRTSLTNDITGDDDSLYGYSPGDDDFDGDIVKDRTDRLADILSQHTDEETVRANRDVLKELAENGPEQWGGARVDFIWHGEVSDGEPDFNEDKTLEFKDPSLLLFNPHYGSGHDVRLKGTFISGIKMVSEEDENEDKREDMRVGRVFLDSQTDGYGWDDVVGLSPGGYKSDVRRL